MKQHETTSETTVWPNLAKLARTVFRVALWVSATALWFHVTSFFLICPSDPVSDIRRDLLNPKCPEAAARQSSLAFQALMPDKTTTRQIMVSVFLWFWGCANLKANGKGVWQSIIWQLHSLVAFQCLQNSSCRQIHTDTTYVRLFSLHHVHEKSTALTVSTASSILSSSWRCLSSCSFSALQQSSRQWNCTKANLSLLPAILCVKETLDRSCL